MQMRHFCKNGKMKGMGAERGKTQNAAFLFRKNREGYVAFTVCAYTVRGGYSGHAFAEFAAFAVDLFVRGSEVAHQVFGHGDGDFTFAGEDG